MAVNQESSTDVNQGAKMDPLIWSAIIDAVIAIGGMIVNGVSQNETNKQNQSNQETQWAREDSEMQRGLADATKAGFSPSAVLGNSWASSLSTQHQAPNIDPSFLVNAVNNTGRGLSDKKRQQPLLDAQTESYNLANESARLENQYKESELRDKAIERTLELIQLRKKNDITEAEYQSLLGSIGSQFGESGQEIVNELKSHRNDSSDYRADNYMGKYIDSSADVHDQYVKVQSSYQSLVNNDFTSASDYRSALRTYETDMHDLSLEIAKADKKFWYEEPYQFSAQSVPVGVNPDGTIQYNDRELTFKNRQLAYEWLENTMTKFNSSFGSVQLRGTSFDRKMQIWNGVNDTFSNVAGTVLGIGNFTTGRMNAETGRMNAETNRMRSRR